MVDLAVMGDVVLACFGRVMGGVVSVAAGGVGVVRRPLVVGRIVMLGSQAVVRRSMLVMFGGLEVMFTRRMG